MAVRVLNFYILTIKKTARASTILMYCKYCTYESILAKSIIKEKSQYLGRFDDG